MTGRGDVDPLYAGWECAHGVDLERPCPACPPGSLPLAGDRPRSGFVVVWIALAIAAAIGIAALLFVLATPRSGSDPTAVSSHIGGPTAGAGDPLDAMPGASDRSQSGAPYPRPEQVGAGIETRPWPRPGSIRGAESFDPDRSALSSASRGQLVPIPLREHYGAPSSPAAGVALRDSQPSGSPDPGFASATTGPMSEPASLGPALVAGLATWYDAPSALDAAAGPALRVGDWRGSWVVVRANGSAVRVRLTDSCWCLGGRLIDLDRRAFRRLAPLSRGVVTVEVETMPGLPATDLAP